MSHLVKKITANLPPAYFALVMALGALSIVLSALGFGILANILLYLNVTIYLILWMLTIMRLVWYFPRFFSDLTSHENGPGFFTLVAGTCIIGSQLLNVVQLPEIAFIVWVIGIALWIVIMYIFFFSITTRDNKPDLQEGINGGWLIAAVATQSVSVLGTQLAPYVTEGRDILIFFTLCMYLLGSMLYINIIALIFYRLTFLPLNKEAITPPYWTTMGAVAITTLAGSTLILHSRYLPLLEELVPFFKGFTLFFWITSTWWIPLLIILMLWRLLYHKVPIRYNAQYWGMVFPIAMYTLSTHDLALALEMPFLFAIPNILIYIALLVALSGLVLMVYHHFTYLKNYFNNSE